MKTLFTIFFTLLISGFSDVQAQNDYSINWRWTDYPKDSATIAFDYQFMGETPTPTHLPFLMSICLSLPNCDKKSFPSPDQSIKLDRFKYQLRDYLDIEIVGAIVGSATKNCQQELYIYTNDTAKIEKEARLIHDSQYRNWNLQIQIKEDKNWFLYIDFLTPKNTSYEEIFMEKVYESLREDGDKLISSREITHYFDMNYTEKKNVQSLIEYLNKEGYKTEIKSGFKLWATKSESADPAILLPVIRTLRLKAQELNATYSGVSVTQVK